MSKCLLSCFVASLTWYFLAGSWILGGLPQKWKAAAVEPEKPEMWSGYDGLNLEGVSRAVEVHVGSLHNRSLLK